MTKSTRFRTQWDENYKSEIFATPIGEDENLVQQHMRDECDINVIMQRYQSTGELTHIRADAQSLYGDFSEIADYKQGIEQIMLADELFMELPSSIRDRFQNDPGQFIDFAVDPKNLEAMREMGLAPAPAPQKHDASAASKPGTGAPAEGPSKAQNDGPSSTS